MRGKLSEPVEPCPHCKEGWRLVGKPACGECLGGTIASLRSALEGSQSLLVAILVEERPVEEIEAQIAENREALSPGYFNRPLPDMSPDDLLLPGRYEVT